MSVDFENVLKAPRQPRVRVRYTPEEEDDDCGSIIAQGFLWFIFLIYLISSIVSFYFFFKYTSDTSVDCKDAFPVLVFIEAMLLLVTGAAPVYFLVKFQLQEEMQAFDWRMFRGVHKRLIAGWVVVILITAAVVLIYGDSLDADECDEGYTRDISYANWVIVLATFVLCLIIIFTRLLADGSITHQSARSKRTKFEEAEKKQRERDEAGRQKKSASTAHPASSAAMSHV